MIYCDHEKRPFLAHVLQLTSGRYVVLRPFPFRVTGNGERNAHTAQVPFVAKALVKRVKLGEQRPSRESMSSSVLDDTT